MSNDPVEGELTDEHRAKRDRRLDEDDAAPHDALPWEDVKAQVLARISDRDAGSARSVEADDELADDLIAHSPKFRDLLAKSLASGREPFPFADPEH